MDAIEVILSLLGVGAASVYLIWAVFAAFNILWAIFSAILAKRRGRNAWNWFFLTCFYGIFFAVPCLLKDHQPRRIS